MRFLKFLKERKIFEGGNAVSNVVKIKAENIKPTLEQYYKKVLKPIGLTKKDWKLLGSAGKKHESGDLDLGIEISKLRKIYKKDNDRDLLLALYNDVKNKVKEISKKGIGQGQLYTKFPIYGKSQKGENVQVDLMIGPLRFMKFAYYAGTDYKFNPEAEDVTKYKGLYRNLLMMSISRVLRKQINDTQYERYLINLSKGLFKAVKSTIGKSGKPVKNHQTISKKFISNTPQDLIDILFGKSFTEKDLRTFESTLKALNSNKFKYPELRNAIKNEFKERLIKMGLEIPKEI